MKKILLLILFLTATFQSFSQTISCDDFKNGVFQFKGFGGAYYTVIRDDSIQLEQSTRRAEYSKMQITWNSNCKYTLTDRIVHKWGEKPQKDTSIPGLKNIIYKVEIVVCHFRGHVQINTGKGK